MKLTCPECFSEFTVPDAQIGPSGRRVRCNVCERIWFQEPDFSVFETTAPSPPAPTDDMTDDIDDILSKIADAPNASGDDVSPNVDDDIANLDTPAPDVTDDVKSFTRFDDGMDFEPIPPSLYPADDDEITHTPKRKSIINKGYLLRLLMGVCVAAAIFALALWLGALAGLHKGPLRAFYKPFGIVRDATPINLSVVDAQADILTAEDGSQKTKITAVLQNTSNDVAYIPLIEMSIMTASGAVSDSVYIKPEMTEIQGQKTLQIEGTLPSAITEDESIRIRFIGD